MGAVFFTICALLFLTSCASNKPLQPSQFHSEYSSPDHFTICHGYSCHIKSNVTLDSSEWAAVISPFDTPSENAETERTVIAKTIANFENTIGAKTGTDRDRAGATMVGYDAYQLDCIDETINTDLYLNFLETKRLLKFHRVITPARRGRFYDGEWPHNSAVIEDTVSGQKFAVDSWFAENGKPPYIVPLERWLSGWRPPKN